MTEENEKKEAPDKKRKYEDPVRLLILDQIADKNIVSPNKLAHILAEQRAKENDPVDIWRKYLMPLKQQAKSLARQKKISILRHGKPIDPNKMKGLIKFGPYVEGTPTSQHESEYVSAKDEE